MHIYQKKTIIRFVLSLQVIIESEIMATVMLVTSECWRLNFLMLVTKSRTCHQNIFVPSIRHQYRCSPLTWNSIKLEKVIETEAMLLNEANLTNSKCISRLGIFFYEISVSDWLFSDESD